MRPWDSTPFVPSPAGRDPDIKVSEVSGRDTTGDGTRAAMIEPTTEAERRPPYVLRLTGEQIGSIDPPPDGDWFVDFDEYEDFVPLRMFLAAGGGPDAAVNAALDKVAARHGPCGNRDHGFDNEPCDHCLCGHLWPCPEAAAIKAARPQP